MFFNEKVDNIELALLAKSVYIKCGPEKGAVCAIDCLFEMNNGHIDKIIEAWKRYITETENNQGHSETERNNCWVPAIPL